MSTNLLLYQNKHYLEDDLEILPKTPTNHSQTPHEKNNLSNYRERHCSNTS